ncbi:two-component system response regulator [Malaciobacter halophilus]|uniref:response regulator transcription factor n=1 Tax=Malaciobacter halophilus TaxID=197482 RepID=UPI000E10662E|nr:response regulator transcription factor [Malaciobacter halophilus]AXH09042.1 two-component system response regulator [Malaciobacter halophilus]
MHNNFKNLTILYVEDDLEIQSNIKKILDLLFAEVYIANNGKEALDIFKTNYIHIVLTDYEMPYLNGYELTQQIRQLSEHIPIVILSNHTEKEKLLKCIPLKLTNYLEKPLEYEKLMDSLNKCKEQLENKDLLNIQITKELAYNMGTKKLSKEFEIIELTALEIDIFEALLNKKNQVIDKNKLISLANSKTTGFTEGSLKNIIYRLRKKVGKEIITNYKNMGYCLKVIKV